MVEEWREVPSKPGLMASSYGRILLPARVAAMPHGGERLYETKPVKGVLTRANKNAKHAYMAMNTKHYGQLKVHQLVCEAFHGEKPFDKAVVIHLDEDATNNRADNLKWGTQKENLNMPGFIDYCKSRTGEDNPFIKGIRKR